MSTTEPTLSQQIETFQEERSVDPERAAIYREEQAALDAAGVPADVLVPGVPMPDADLLDPYGHPTTLTAARAGRRAVVVFYRGGWCPYCNITLRTYQRQLLPDLDRQDIALIAVSPQDADNSLSTKEKNELAFAVVSDPGNKLARQLGILTAPTDAARAGQLSHGLDIAELNSDRQAEIPMPTVLIVDADGTLSWIDVHPNYTTRTEPATILAALDRSSG